VQQYHAIPSFFHIYNQLKWRKGNQKQVESRWRKTQKRCKEPKLGEPKAQTAKNKKKVQDALHDAVATDDDVECPTPIDKEPKQGEPMALPFTQEMTPDRLDAITVMDPQIEETSSDVASAVAIGDNSRFAIADKTNENPHTNDGEESTVPKVANDDDGLLNVVIPRKNRQDLWNLNHSNLNQQRVSKQYAFLSCIVL
jgi:hypothetical protein